MTKITSIKPVADSGLTQSVATSIFDQISAFAGYGFNKSHAAAYASVAFQTAYLKTHYPECYFAAAMNMDIDIIDDIAQFANQLHQRGICLWAPDVNLSVETFRPIKLRKEHRGYSYAIAYALSAIRGVGCQAAADIVQERQSGPYKSLKDFIGRLGQKVNRKALSALIHAGAFDKITENRADAAAEGDGAKKSNAAAGQMSMFDMVPDLDTSEVCAEYDYNTRLDLEFDVLGHYLSDHPLKDLRKTIFAQNQYFANTIFDLDRKPPRIAKMAAIVIGVDLRHTKKGEIMAIVTLSDPDRTYETLAFGDTWGEIKAMLRKKNRVEVTTTVIAENDDRRLIIESVRPLEQASVHEDVIAA